MTPKSADANPILLNAAGREWVVAFTAGAIVRMEHTEGKTFGEVLRLVGRQSFTAMRALLRAGISDRNPAVEITEDLLDEIMDEAGWGRLDDVLSKALERDQGARDAKENPRRPRRAGTKR